MDDAEDAHKNAHKDNLYYDWLTQFRRDSPQYQGAVKGHWDKYIDDWRELQKRRGKRREWIIGICALLLFPLTIIEWPGTWYAMAALFGCPIAMRYNYKYTMRMSGENGRGRRRP